MYIDNMTMERMGMRSNMERGETMPKILAFEWPTRVEKKLENGIISEDYAAWNEEEGYFIVADGVSRDVYQRKGYSPAREAAELAVKAMAQRFSSDDREKAIPEAFQQANQAVRRLNEEEGLWGEGNHNYLDHDLAGTCAAALVRGDNEFHFGYVGDCRIVHLSPDGALFITPDQVTEARAEFPKEGTREERAVTIRKERRNNPTDLHRTYGVLTGEEAALDPVYLKTGRLKCKPGDVIAVCSDGVAPFIENDELFRQLLLSGDENTIRQHVTNPDSPHQNKDEKTLILYRV